MLVDVVTLRRKGVRLRQPELSPAVRGELSFTDETSTSFKRPVRAAHLHEVKPGAQVQRALLLPLFEAEVVLIEGPTIVIAGIELDSAVDAALGQHRVTEYGQVWRCTVAGAEDR